MFRKTLFGVVAALNAVSLGGGGNFRQTVSIDKATGPSSEYTIEYVCRG